VLGAEASPNTLATRHAIVNIGEVRGGPRVGAAHARSERLGERARDRFGLVAGQELAEDARAHGERPLGLVVRAEGAAFAHARDQVRVRHVAFS
jgi:hypothetical protein